MCFWPCTCLLWRNVYSDLPGFFIGLFALFDTELYDLFEYFGDSSFDSHTICKYCLPFCGLSFHFAYNNAFKKN